MESTEGNYIYWVGSSLGRDGSDVYLKSFEECIKWVKDHIRDGVKLFEIKEF
jgi:hypothetical protein